MLAPPRRGEPFPPRLFPKDGRLPPKEGREFTPPGRGELKGRLLARLKLEAAAPPGREEGVEALLLKLLCRNFGLPSERLELSELLYDF